MKNNLKIIFCHSKKMPFKYRKPYSRKSMRRPKKSYRKKSIGKSKSVVNLRRQVHWFKRRCKLATLSITEDLAPSAPLFDHYTFQFSDIGSPSEFSALFDQIKLHAVKIEFHPAFTTQTTGDAVANTLPSFHTAIDLTDSTDPTTVNQLLEYESVKTTRGNRVHKRYLKPCAWTADVSGQVGVNRPIRTYLAMEDANWVDVEHLGLKICIDPATSVILRAYTIQVYATYYFSCKNVK